MPPSRLRQVPDYRAGRMSSMGTDIQSDRPIVHARRALPASELARHRVQAGLQPPVRLQLPLELADALLELTYLDAQPIGLRDLGLVAQDHPVGRPQRRPSAVRPARLQRSPAAPSR